MIRSVEDIDEAKKARIENATFEWWASHEFPKVPIVSNADRFKSAEIVLTVASKPLDIEDVEYPTAAVIFDSTTKLHPTRI